MSAFTSDMQFELSAGIDVGGTKIEATLFDREFDPVVSHRIDTPRESYEQLLDALVAEANWLRNESGARDLPVGIGIPGIIDPQTGRSETANLPATGRMLLADLQVRLGGILTIENDCKCFAFSEANGGSGSGYSRVYGVVIGTGLGGGLCTDGRLVAGANGLVGEVGHFGVPAHVCKDLGLPVLPCGCGRRGCYETFVSGPGLTALGQVLTGRKYIPEVIAEGARAGDATLERVFNAWLYITAELFHTVQLTLDPECIVIGGGLSNISGLDSELSTRLDQIKLASVRMPQIVIALFKSSGCRGAALLAARRHCESKTS